MLTLPVNAHALIEGEDACSSFIGYDNAEIEHFKKDVLKESVFSTGSRISICGTRDYFLFKEI